MKKFKNVISVVGLILLFGLVNFLSIVIFSLGFKLFSHIDINSEEYVLSLANFLNKSKIFIVLLSGVILLPIIKKNFRQIKINLIPLKKLWYYILIGISTSLTLNIIMYDLGIQSNTNIIFEPIYSIIATAILGPILEEIIFRGIVYNKLKQTFSHKYAIIIVSLLFALFHLNLSQGLYVFFFSLVITLFYEKTNNLTVPILIHTFGNLAISLIYPYLLNINVLILQVILFVLISTEVIMLVKFKNIK